VVEEKTNSYVGSFFVTTALPVFETIPSSP
jgi:hypothetical protein